MAILPVTIASEPAPEGRCPDAAGQMEIILAEGVSFGRQYLI
jgi:hypothetical protein